MSEAILNGYFKQGGSANNALATVSSGNIRDQRVYATRIRANYSAAVAGVRSITLLVAGVQKLQIMWDFSKGEFDWNLPIAIRGQYGNDLGAGGVDVQLQASGTGGILGRVGIGYFVR